MNNHPVHLSNTRKLQTAFIPFCALGEDMKIMGTNIDGFDVPVCDSFVPKNHEKQLCYEVELDRFRNDSILLEQLKSGLVLLLDFNEIRQLDDETSNKTKRNIFSADDENSFTIHLDTISKYNDSFFVLNFNKIFRPCKNNKRGTVQSQLTKGNKRK